LLVNGRHFENRRRTLGASFLTLGAAVVQFCAYQKPHCRVATIQSPSVRFVRA
jgi:hypothetical protein